MVRERTLRTIFPLRPLRPRIRHSGESRNPGAVRGRLCGRYSDSFGCGFATLGSSRLRDEAENLTDSIVLEFVFVQVDPQPRL